MQALWLEAVLHVLLIKHAQLICQYVWCGNDTSDSKLKSLWIMGIMDLFNLQKKKNAIACSPILSMRA